MGLRQRRHGLDAHVDDGTAGNVIDHDRQLHAFGDRREVGEKTLLRRFVVIGRDDEDRVRTGLLRMLRKLDRFDRIIGPGTGDDRYAPRRRLDAQFHDLLMLVVGKRRRFTRGAHRHKAVAALFYLPLHMRDETIRINRAGGGERRYECGNGTLEHAQLLTTEGAEYAHALAAIDG